MLHRLRAGWRGHHILIVLNGGNGGEGAKLISGSANSTRWMCKISSADKTFLIA